MKTLGFYLVDHQGFDRLRRVACRLPPRLPVRSPSERSLLECSPDILADARALAGSPPDYIKKPLLPLVRKVFYLVDHQGFEPWTP